MIASRPARSGNPTTTCRSNRPGLKRAVVRVKLRRLKLPATLRSSWPLGTIDGHQAVDIERSYVVAFFDQELRGRHQSLFVCPSPQSRAGCGRSVHPRHLGRFVFVPLRVAAPRASAGPLVFPAFLGGIEPV